MQTYLAIHLPSAELVNPLSIHATAWIDRGDLKGGDGVALDVPADGLGEHDDGKVSRLSHPACDSSRTTFIFVCAFRLRDLDSPSDAMSAFFGMATTFRAPCILEALALTAAFAGAVPRDLQSPRGCAFPLTARSPAVNASGLSVGAVLISLKLRMRECLTKERAI